MKIGIITFHASYNCGSILQCLALKEYLLNLGHDVEIINYSSIAQQKIYSVFYKKPTVRNIVKNILCIPGYRNIKEHYKQYKNYIKKAFHVDDKYYTTSEELSINCRHFDMIISGGDQIWNVSCEDFSTAYFIDFNNSAYKISYSPSLGATNINKSKQSFLYKTLLSKYDAISCREENGAKWLHEFTGRHITLAADPTMLFTGDQWNSFIQNNHYCQSKGDYIFYYAFSHAGINNKKIQQIASENDLKVVVIDSKQWFIKQLWRYKNFILSKESGPDAFLRYIKESNYVITTSFHGTVFSLLFHKQFVYINGRNHNPQDDRTSFLINYLGIKDRFIDIDDLSMELLKKRIDYNKVDKKIDEFRLNSAEYLINNINLAKERV